MTIFIFKTSFEYLCMKNIIHYGLYQKPNYYINQALPIVHTNYQMISPYFIFLIYKIFCLNHFSFFIKRFQNTNQVMPQASKFFISWILYLPRHKYKRTGKITNQWKEHNRIDEEPKQLPQLPQLHHDACINQLKEYKELVSPKQSLQYIQDHISP